MHRKPESDLSTLDTELERTLRNLRKVKRAGEATMADERINQTVEQETAAERLQRHDTMEDFWRPVIQAEYSAVRQLAVEANNFELIVVKGAPRRKRRQSAAMAPRLSLGEAPSRRRTENGKGARLP